MLRAALLASVAALLSVAPASAQYRRNVLSYDGAPPWVKKPASVPGAATIDLDFANGRYWPSYALGRIAVTRASVAEEDGPSGIWYPFASGQLRVTGNGALIEEARTNSIRNNSNTGGSAPSTPPTNWTVTASGLSISYAYGTQLGLPYVDITLSGTTSGTTGSIVHDTTTAIAATNGQTWALSGIYSLSGGSLANVTSAFQSVSEFTSAPALLLAVNVGAVSLTSTPLRASGPLTITGATAATAQPGFQFTWANGAAINLTVRISGVQFERSTLIAGSVASAAVNTAGSGYGNTLTGTMTWATGGTCGTAPVLNVTTTAGGAIATVNSVTAAGSCSVFPTAAATWTPGGGLSAGTSATFTLTPTNNAAAAGATSPILTTSAAATRAADVVTMVLPGSALSTSGYGLLGIGTPELPIGYPQNQNLAQLSSGTDAQRMVVRRQSTTGALLCALPGGTGGNAVPAGTWAQNVAGKLSYFASIGTGGCVFNGASALNAPSALPAAPTVLQIGMNNAGTEQFDGYVSRVVIAPASLLAN